MLGWTDAGAGRSGTWMASSDVELLRAFSSMNNGKGLPQQAEVEAMLGWTDARGQRSPGRGWPVQYGAAARLLVLNNGKGLPQQAEVEAMLGWTDARGRRSGTWRASSIWAVSRLLVHE